MIVRLAQTASLLIGLAASALFPFLTGGDPRIGAADLAIAIAMFVVMQQFRRRSRSASAPSPRIVQSRVLLVPIFEAGTNFRDIGEGQTLVAGVVFPGRPIEVLTSPTDRSAA